MGEFAGQQGDKNPTAKIWAVFLVSLLTTAAVFYWSYSNLERVTVSLETLSRPGEKGDMINEIFQEIIEAENHIHSYILTGDTLSRAMYRGRIAHARNTISALGELLQGDTLQILRVDTLKSIFDLKINYLEKYLYVKRLKQSSLFTSEAMDRIAVEMNDTAFIDKQFLKREIIRGEEVPVEKEEIVVTPDEFRGFNGFLRKLLGRDHTRIDTFRTIENETSYTYGVAVDTSIVRDYFMDSTLVAVKNILASVMSKELTLQERLTETELRLMRQNKVFIANIRMVIEALRAQETALASANRKKAMAMADESTRMLFVIGFGGVLMSGVFIFLILRDVTRADHYRRQLEREKTKAEKLARVKEDFLSSMSHEIRTPLHNIMGFSSLLERTSLDVRQEEYMKAIRASHSYLSELVNSILDRAKIDAGKLHLLKEPFDPVSVVLELKSIYAYAALKKNILLHSAITEELNDLHLVGDAFRIKQILNNLLSNAVKFTESGSVIISLNGSRNGGSFDLKIMVSDTGPGIQEDKLLSIFEPFVQEKAVIASTFGGTGLGLSIARSLAEAMGGRITAANNPEGGACFTVDLSLPHVPAAVVSPQANDTLQACRTDATAVVVEDDHWNAVLLEEILRPRVNAVRVFSDATKALRFIEDPANRTDIVFTDINMPGMDGEVFMENIKAGGITIPVVAVTAHMQREKFESLLGKGFDRVCNKPFRISDIENILNHYFDAGAKAVEGSTFTAPSENKINTDGTAPFDFSLIRAFAGENEVLFIRLIKELVDNNTRQVSEFSAHLRHGDGKKLADLSHQMKTTYDTLKLHSVSESLGGVELHERLGRVDRVVEMGQEIYPELERILSALKKVVRHQFHTV